jgi:ubiquinone/menaquinone biosynthesis C-methylase UbiE
MAQTTLTAEEFGERLFGSTLHLIDVLAVYLGDRLGWYRALAEGGPATAAELVARAGGAERYAREWLEQQAGTGILTLEDDGRFALPPGAAEVLTDSASLSYLAPLARMFGAAAVQLPALVEAYRTGGGVGWAEFGVDMRESQADMNRPWFELRLAGAFASVPDLHDVLRRPDARLADIGCGGGWSTIALARAYPAASVDGWDVDGPSIELARRNAAEGGLADRVRFHVADAAGLPEQEYDAVFAFEAVHDMPRPVEVLAGMRRALRPGGAVVVMDEAVADSYAAPGDELERLMYGFSLFICLPDGMSSQPSAATGTVMRTNTLRGYAQRAGFADVEVLPIEEFGFWRFYRLVAR